VRVALLILTLIASVAWPDVCAPSKSCCRGGSCALHLQAANGNCHHHDTRPPVAHRDPATTPSTATIAQPVVAEVRFAPTHAYAPDAEPRTPDHPPRLDPPSRWL
jgi:hypothetical protein